MLCRHTGHFVTRFAHSLQHEMCPHSKNTVSGSASRQITHKCSGFLHWLHFRSHMILILNQHKWIPFRFFLCWFQNDAVVAILCLFLFILSIYCPRIALVSFHLFKHRSSCTLQYSWGRNHWKSQTFWLAAYTILLLIMSYEFLQIQSRFRGDETFEG